MTVTELRDFIFENYYKQIGFARANSFYSILIKRKKIYNCLNLNLEKYQMLVIIKEYYNSYLKRKNMKLVKRWKIQQLKAIRSPNIADIKSVIIEYSKTSHNLSKAT